MVAFNTLGQWRISSSSYNNWSATELRLYYWFAAIVTLIRVISIWINTVYFQIHDDVIKWKHLPRLLCGEFTGHRWIPRTRASDEEFWCFLWYATEPTVEKTMETPVICNAIALSMTPLPCVSPSVSSRLKSVVRQAVRLCVLGTRSYFTDTL